MPISKDSFENFYQGASAENYVSSLFYFAGYEASKLNPDTGIDLLVTNVARSKFKDEPEVSAKIQVKSAIRDSKGAVFYMAEEELEFLCSADDRFTVFVILGNFTGLVDPASFDIYADRVDRAIDEDMRRYEESLMSESGRERKAKGFASIFDFVKSDFSIFWLNSAQMLRAKNDGVWRAHKDGKYALRVDVKDGGISIEEPLSGSVESYSIHIVPELREIRYIMRPCRSNDKFKAGCFSYDHL